MSKEIKDILFISNELTKQKLNNPNSDRCLKIKKLLNLKIKRLLEINL